MPRQTPCTTYCLGAFTLDLDRGALLSPTSDELRLRPKSFALLCFLVENAGRLLTQDAIMEALWPNVFVIENNVSQCVSEIRKALGEAGARMLRTVPRRGYLFTPEARPGRPDGLGAAPSRGIDVPPGNTLATPDPRRCAGDTVRLMTASSAGRLIEVRQSFRNLSQISQDKTIVHVH